MNSTGSQEHDWNFGTRLELRNTTGTQEHDWNSGTRLELRNTIETQEHDWSLCPIKLKSNTTGTYERLQNAVSDQQHEKERRSQRGTIFEKFSEFALEIAEFFKRMTERERGGRESENCRMPSLSCCHFQTSIV